MKKKNDGMKASFMPAAALQCFVYLLGIVYTPRDWRQDVVSLAQ